MIGERGLADIIGKYDYEENPPKGWKEIGVGGYRYAYLGPDGVVYKVMHGTDDGIDINQLEVETARKLRRRKILWRYDIGIPEITGHRVRDADGYWSTVNAMPYLPTEKVCACPSWHWHWYEESDVYDIKMCRCRRWGEARTCFGVQYRVMEQELGLLDIWDPNLSYYDKLTWIIDLGE